MSETAQNKTNQQNSNNQPTALVAGGAGFIGSHLCSTLVAQNFNVVCIDNLSTGKKENIKDILTSPNFTFFEADINNSDFKLSSELKFDYVFHLASIEEYQNHQDFSLDTLLVNSLGTKFLLEVAKENQAKFILFSAADLYSGAISTSSLRYYFGKSPEGESILSIHEAKRFAEALVFEYFKKFKLPTTIIRLKDVYGPRMNLERGDDIANLLKEALANEPLKIFGDGLEILNPTFVSDVIFGAVKASLGDYNGEIFVLVNNEKVTVESFAQTIKLVVGPLEIEHKKDKNEVSFPEIPPDLTNTKEKIGWKPKVTLAEGIAAVLQDKQIASTKEIASQQELSKEKKAEEVISLTGKEVVTERSVTKKKNLGLFLRIAVFLASFLLLALTIITPLMGTIYNGYFGTRALNQSYSDLEKEHATEAEENSLKAQNHFNSASLNLQNISWLLKMTGFNDESANLDHVFTASGNLAEAVGNSAKANKILIEAASREELTPLEAEEKLDQSLIRLYESQVTLEETDLVLKTVEWSATPALITPGKSFLETKSQELSEEVNQLIKAIEKSLSIGL